MKTIEITIYKFDELSESAKETAIQNYRESSYADDVWQGERVDSFREAEKIYQALNNLEGEISGARLYTWIENNIMSGFRKPALYQKLNGFNVFGKQGIIKDYFKHSNATKTRLSKVFSYNNIDNCPLTGVCYDFDFLQPIIDFMKKPDRYTTNENLTIPDYETVAQCDYDYQSSDSYIIETIQANEYEFTEDGERY